MSTLRVANVSFDVADTNRIGYHQDQVIRLTSTGAMKLPSGGSAIRPTVTESGLFRYNTDTSSLEFRNASTWIRLPNYTVDATGAAPSGGFDGDVWYRV